MPVVDTLTSKGWRVRYLCQEDISLSAADSRKAWVTRISSLPGVTGIAHRQQMLAAIAERLQMGWFAAEITRDEGFTSVHLHDPWLAFGFWLGLKCLRLNNVRWGITEHGFGCYSRATHEDGLTQGPRLQRWLRRLEAFTLGVANWVVAPTQLALNQLARDLGLPFNPDHWRVIPHAATPNTHEAFDQARKHLGWSADEFHVIGVGRLVPLKRFDILVGACASLASRYPAVHLHLLGDGDRAGLQQLANTGGFGDRIHFEVVDDVGPYLAAADVYASTSMTESFGLANFEALMAGLPCICTAVGGVPEVMGHAAWLIPVDQDAMSRALEELICKPEQRLVLSVRAAAQAERAPKLASITDQYAELFHS